MLRPVASAWFSLPPTIGSRAGRLGALVVGIKMTTLSLLGSGFRGGKYSTGRGVTVGAGGVAVRRGAVVLGAKDRDGGGGGGGHRASFTPGRHTTLAGGG